MQAFTKAISVVAWVGVLTLIIDYICAVVLTQLVGKNAQTWGDDASHLFVSLAIARYSGGASGSCFSLITGRPSGLRVSK